jgi:hypothetical protein
MEAHTHASRLSPELIRRVRGEYLEMPGLRLTTRQAQRLFGLDSETCEALLTELQNAKFLTRTHGGLFMVREAKA